TLDALFVDALGGLEDVEIDADGASKMDEGLLILRKTKTSETQACRKKLSANARVETHGVGDFLDVGADALAKIGNNVGVADLQSEERIRGVFDELGAVDGGDQEFRGIIRRAGAVVHRAVECAIENRAIDLTQGGRGGLVLDANDDAIGMEEIFNGGAF